MIHNGEGAPQEVMAPASPVSLALAPTQPVVEASPMQKVVDTFKTWELSIGRAHAYGLGDASYWSGSSTSSETVTSTSYFYDGYYSDYDSSYTDGDYEADGLGISASKYFNKYIGSDFGLSFLNVNEIYGDESFIQARAGLVVTPLRLNIFGHDFLEFSGIAGFANFKRYTIEYADDYASKGEIVGDTNVIKPYLGIRVAFNFTDKVAFVIDSFSAESDDYVMNSGSGSLRYRF